MSMGRSGVAVFEREAVYCDRAPIGPLSAASRPSSSIDASALVRAHQA